MRTTVYGMSEDPQPAGPRERLEMLGAERLTDQELLAILLGTGSRACSALDLAGQLLGQYQSLSELQDLTQAELMEQKGVGTAKAATIAAAIEFGKRVHNSTTHYRPVITGSVDAARLLQSRLRGLDREHFMVMMLNPKNAVLGVETVSIGTLNCSLVHPREVFKQAIKRSAAAVVLAHNHPSGVCEPSKEDMQVTRRLKDAGELVGITVIDHLIIGEDQYYSFCENELL